MLEDHQSTEVPGSAPTEGPAPSASVPDASAEPAKKASAKKAAAKKTAKKTTTAKKATKKAASAETAPAEATAEQPAGDEPQTQATGDAPAPGTPAVLFQPPDTARSTSSNSTRSSRRGEAADPARSYRHPVGSTGAPTALEVAMHEHEPQGGRP